ncbi:S1 RNA-binding domain-containing protein [Scatolibacter rhodanostii]|uniref:S1 RNA-binding domain-containing protein n=1 Tax=Scatolibacter rhodanostii TaxID=2014781 RepID=UPI000C084F2D|nr:S1 RNA-binding domain-containing protein [Scatolibacter rhodanostii]
MNFYPEGRLIDTPENQNAFISEANLADACQSGKILEARAVMCDSKHNLVVDLLCMKGIIPREEGALGIKEGTMRDIAILSRVNHPVCFVIKEFIRTEKGEAMAILSRREVQQKCKDEYISQLALGDVIDAKVTHLEAFGVFADIGCGIVALLPIDSISVSRIEHPSERFLPGMYFKAIVKSSEKGRITLSHKELLGTWKENAEHFSAGETVSGIVRSVESYGIFVELTPNLAGLAELKAGVVPGQRATVFIKSILPSKMKIKLIIIETLEAETQKPHMPQYFFLDQHIDKFTYSPPECEKEIFTDFTESFAKI